MPEIYRIDDLDGVEVEASEQHREQLVKLIGGALDVATSLAPDQPLASEIRPGGLQINLAASAAAQTVTALLGAASAKCHLSSPSEDIGVRVNSEGNLIVRCYHSPAHEWDMDGKRIS
jgi:hypothetical protein